MTTHQAAVAHYYRQFRGNLERPAESAYRSARSFVAFRKRLGEEVRKHKEQQRRRKAAARKRAASCPNS